jgi:hypothetical protein
VFSEDCRLPYLKEQAINSYKHVKQFKVQIRNSFK